MEDPYSFRAAAFEAATAGDLQTLRHLVPSAVGVDETDDRGVDLLRVCAAWAHADLAGYLLSEGAAVEGTSPSGSTLLMVAAMSDVGASTVRLLLDAGADVNARASNGVTPVLCCLFSPDSSDEVLGLLIEAGADLSARDTHGKSASHYAPGRIVKALDTTEGHDP